MSARSGLAALSADLRALAHSPRELWIVYAMKLFESIGYFAIYSLLAIFLSDDHALDDAQAGAVVGGWQTAISLVVFMAGFIADAMGVRRALLVAAISTMAGRWFLALTPSLGGVYLALALAVWGIGSMKPTMNAAVRSYTTAATVAFAFSIYYVLMNVGAAMQGPLIDGFRAFFKQGLDVGGWHFSSSQAVFAVGACCSTINVGLALCLRQAPPELAAPLPLRNPFRIAQEVLSERAFWRFLTFVALLTFVRLIFQHAHTTWPKYAIREFGEDFHFASYWSINPVMVIVLTPFATLLTRQFKPYPVIVAGALVSALSVFAMAFSTSVTASLVFIVALSIGEVVWSPRLYEYTATVAPRGRESSYMGLAEVPMFVAKMGAGYMSGWLLMTWCPKEGPRDSTTMWLVIGLMTLAAPVLMLFLRSSLEVAEQEDPDVTAGPKRA